jgi:hypothetical protein
MGRPSKCPKRGSNWHEAVRQLDVLDPDAYLCVVFQR